MRYASHDSEPRAVRSDSVCIETQETQHHEDAADAERHRPSRAEREVLPRALDRPDGLLDGVGLEEVDDFADGSRFAGHAPLRATQSSRPTF